MADLEGNSTAGEFLRARRFSIQTVLRYRATSDGNWHEGRTENISQSGVLFRAENAVPPRTPLEMRFVLPLAMSVERPAEVLCRGVVVRTIPPGGSDGLPVVAARITDYRFLRAQNSASV